MNLTFRYLKANEVECRVAKMKDNGLSLLLYKDARCDMNILDETVGAMNWQRKHTRDNANCIVSIWDSDKKQWIEKEDTGTESYTEKEKGIASDSFKRACFNWGIGRELYTPIFIWIRSADYETYQKNGKSFLKDKFKVSSMKVENGKITALQIENISKHKIVFTLGEKPTKQNNFDEPPIFSKKVCSECGNNIETVKKKNGEIWSASDIIGYSERQFGKVLCANCTIKALKKV